MTRIQNGPAAFFDFSGLHGVDVIGSGPMALLARDAWRRMGCVEAAAERGSCGMAAEAAVRFVVRQAAA